MGLQHPDIVGKNDLTEIAVDACRTHLVALQLLKAVRKDIKAVTARQILEHLEGMWHQLLLGRYHRKEVFGKAFGQIRIALPHLLQRIEKTLAVELFLRYLPLTVLFPQLEVASLIEAVEMVEGREETGVSILDVHFFERVARIGRKGPQGIVEVKKYILVQGGHKFTKKIEQGPDNSSACQP